VFLDRDGTLIRHIPYLHDPGAVELLPTVTEGLLLLRAAGCRLYLHTNQAGVGRGYFTLAEAVACNDSMLARIGLGVDLFAEICVAPERPDQPAQYRKPSPRFAREIMDRARLGVADLCYVGDNLSDLETARNVGCAAAGLTTGVHDLRALAAGAGLSNYPLFDRFVDAARWIVDSAEDARGS
jgi:D-glycero-D-manno-heptose 1,7-bisphosphate phosphatase